MSTSGASRKILSGNEAIAHGAWSGGVDGQGTRTGNGADPLEKGKGLKKGLHKTPSEPL